MRAPVSAEAAGARLPAVIFHAERPAGDGAPNGAAKVDEHEGGPQHHDESHSNHGQDDEGSHAPDGSASGPGVLRLVGLVALEGLWPVKARAGEMAGAAAHHSCPAGAQLVGLVALEGLRPVKTRASKQQGLQPMTHGINRGNAL